MHKQAAQTSREVYELAFSCVISPHSQSSELVNRGCFAVWIAQAPAEGFLVGLGPSHPSFSLQVLH